MSNKQIVKEMRKTIPLAIASKSLKKKERKKNLKDQFLKRNRRRHKMEKFPMFMDQQNQ
jgi:hypothetical protein